ncbi:MAG TPA: tol-pal system-associated acyl-CoA thioesterase [Legionella sp.]|nr:tol-pal system-associated acyl-CoA thioesterase [Legionella sp.]
MQNKQTYQHMIRVYAEDVDFMGIVYHANYLCYLERARTEMLRQNNLMLSDLAQSEVLFAINELKIKYLYPAKLDDLLTITTEYKILKRCSLVFNQSITNQQGTLIVNAEVNVVCVNRNLKPIKVPKLI